VRALLAGDGAGVDGDRFTLAPGTTLTYPRVRFDVPLLVGTWGRETARWAGTVAQEVKVGGSANPDLVPIVREWIGNPEVKVVLGSVCVLPLLRD
jgi:5,10-methylenetetrahydromethanopterin reductase